jgi:hypothetical protein
MERFAALFLTGIAVICIYAGYQLFCDLPAASRGNRLRVFLLNIVPGALLALIGMGIFTAQVRTLISHKPFVEKHQRSTAGAPVAVRRLQAS